MALIAVSSILGGCGRTEAPHIAETPVASRAAPSFDVPVTASDIQTFLDVVSNLPDGTLPQFEPLAESTLDDRLPAATLAAACRREYRAQFDPVEQARRWNRKRPLMNALTARGLKPEEFAALLTRLGSALAASAVESRDEITAAATKADEQLQSLIEQIDQWDRLAAEGKLNPRHVAQYRQPLIDRLKDLVALSEFTRILLSVPEESLSAIEQRRAELARLLPDSGDWQRFERTLDTEAVIVPAGFESTPSARPQSAARGH